MGCSNGGREGLIAAQRHPEDFDGIIARAPAANFTGLIAAGQRIQRAVNAPGGRLTPTQLSALETATLAHCDPLNGVADGFASNYHCTHDPSLLRCEDDNAPDGSCLTTANLATLAAIHEDTPLPYAQVDMRTSLAGFGHGSEGDLLAYPAWIVGSDTVSAFTTPLGLQAVTGFLRYFIAEDETADVLTLDLPTFAIRLAARSAQLDATNPDLSAFAARGGKLILWHGASDYAVPLAETVRYFEAVRAFHSSPGSEARPDADSFVRFYLAPGVLHCGNGPGGAEEPDKLFATLRAWVKDSTTPPDRLDHLVAASETRPAGAATWCRYPNYLQDQETRPALCVAPGQ